MRAALAIFASALSLQAQTFTLVRSEIKTAPAKSTAGAYTITGALSPTTTRSTAGAYAVEGGYTALTFTPPIPGFARIRTVIQPNNNLLMYWPQGAPGFYLETSPNMRFPAWTIINPPRGT